MLLIHSHALGADETCASNALYMGQRGHALKQGKVSGQGRSLDRRKTSEREADGGIQAQRVESGTERAKKQCGEQPGKVAGLCFKAKTEVSGFRSFVSRFICAILLTRRGAGVQKNATRISCGVLLRHTQTDNIATCRHVNTLNRSQVLVDICSSSLRRRRHV